MNDLVVIGDAAAGLPELADRINETVIAANESVHSAFQHAMQAGALLLKAKEVVGHGGFGNWLEENCKVIAPRTAQMYMRLYSKVKELPEAEAQHVAQLPIRRAIQVVSAISATPEAPFRYSYSRSLHVSKDSQTVDTLKASTKAINKLAGCIGHSYAISPAQAEAVRKKLIAAIEVLDALAPRITA